MRTDPKEALPYFCIVKDDAFRKASIQSLVLESKEFDLLLGRHQPDGTFRRGVAAQYLKASEVKEITALAAAESARAGQYEEAVRLYDLAEVSQVSCGCWINVGAEPSRSCRVIDQPAWAVFG